MDGLKDKGLEGPVSGIQSFFQLGLNSSAR